MYIQLNNEYNMRNFVSYLYFSVSGHIFNIFLKIVYIYAIYSRFDLVLHCFAFTVCCTYAGHVNKQHCTYKYTVRVCSYFRYTEHVVPIYTVLFTPVYIVYDAVVIYANLT